MEKIPTLDEIFTMIEYGVLDLEDDEVISYYYNYSDKEVCTSTFEQVMHLYNIKEELV